MSIRDREGYVWLATDNGLVKYNGYSFEVYNTDNGGLPANDVFNMHEDNRGRIWLTTFSYDFGYLDNGKFKRVTYKSGNRIVTPQYLTDHKGLVYFSELMPSGYRVIIVDDDVIKIIPFNTDLLSTEGIDSIYNITLGADLDIRIWSAGNHLYKWDPSLRGHLRYLGKYPEEFRYVFIHRMAVSPSGKSYLFKPGANELHFIDQKTLEYKYRSLIDWGANNSEKIVTISPAFYRHNFIDHTAFITNTHTYSFTEDMELLERQKNSDIIPSILQLSYRMKDKDSNYWYCTNGDGVWVRPTTYGFYCGRQRNDILDKSKYVGSAGNTSMWWDNIGSELYIVVQGKISKRIKFNSGFEVKGASGNDTVTYLSTTNGIYRYNRRTGNIVNIEEVYRVYESVFGFNDDKTLDKNGKLVLRSLRKILLIGNSIYGLNSGGLIKLTFDGDELQANKFDLERFTDLFYDEHGKLLYTYGNQKILIGNLVNDTYRTIDYTTLKQHGIKNIRHLEKDTFGNLFILDDHSLLIYNEHSGRSKNIETRFSFSDGGFRIIGNKLYVAGKFGIGYANIKGPGKVGDFYVVANSGMNRYNKIEDLIVNRDGNCILNNDLEWFTFSADSLIKYGVSVNRQNGFFDLASIAPNKRGIHKGDTLKLKQEASILKLDAINYNGKGTVKYIYRISENANWETSTSGELFLTSLSSGKYHKVECRLKDDLWESGTYTFYIYRYPKWWQTSTWKTIFWATGILLFIAIMVIAVLITRYYVARKNERKRALTELELQAIHSQINPHFIFNTLSAALFYINKKRFDDAYVHVNKFSQLLRSYLKSSQDRYIMLDEEIKMLRNYIELQQIRFEEKFEFHIEIDNKLPTNNVRIPSLLLQPLVENAINHGLFHREKGGILLLKFEQGTDNSELICTIEDNGVGRSTGKKINETNTTRESYGTKLTNRLLEVFKLYENLNIDLKYFDKELPETGTIVILTLKNVKYVA